MEHWEYTLQGETKVLGLGIHHHGGREAGKNHTSKDGKSINMGDVRIMNSVDDSYFSDQARSLTSLK